MNIPFMSLKVTEKNERSKYHEILDRFLDHGIFIEGSELTNFENSIKEKFNTTECIGVSSGTGALYLALKSLNIKKGDEIIVPCLSWYSTAIAITEIGATPIFADIDSELLIDISSVKSLITDRTKAIIPVHFMGNICQMDKLTNLNIPIIEDASQAFGSTYNGVYAGSYGDIGCISLNPMKSLGAFGDAGLIVCKSKKIAQKIKSFRYCGMNKNKENIGSSLNFRLDALQAAFLNIKLRDFEQVKSKRIEIYKKYVNAFKDKIEFLKISKGCCPYGFTIFSDSREDFIKYLNENGIETKIQHDPLMSELKLYENLKNDCVNGKEIVKKIFNIPFFQDLKDGEIDYIIEKVLAYGK